MKRIEILTESDDDVLEIKKCLDKHGSVFFPFESNQYTCLNVFLSLSFKTIATLPWGGQPNGHIVIGIQGRGMTHYPYYGTAKTSVPGPEYLSEKLDIPLADTEALSRLLGKLKLLEV